MSCIQLLHMHHACWYAYMARGTPPCLPAACVHAEQYYILTFTTTNHHCHWFAVHVEAYWLVLRPIVAGREKRASTVDRPPGDAVPAVRPHRPGICSGSSSSSFPSGSGPWSDLVTVGSSVQTPAREHTHTMAATCMRVHSCVI